MKVHKIESERLAKIEADRIETERLSKLKEDRTIHESLIISSGNKILGETKTLAVIKYIIADIGVIIVFTSIISIKQLTKKILLQLKLMYLRLM